MEILLLKNVPKLGISGNAVKVASGYGRYLMQRGYAVFCNKDNLALFEKQKHIMQQKNDAILASSKKHSSQLENKHFIFVRNASDDGRLFGSVNKKDILKQIMEQYEEISYLSHTNILLHEPIRNVGIIDIQILVHPDLAQVNILVNVATSEQSAVVAMEKYLSTINL